MSLIVHQMELVLDFSKSTVGSLLFTGSQGFVATVKPFSDNHAINNGKNVQPRGNYLRFGKSSTSWECGRDPAIFYYNSIGQLPWQHCQLFDRMWLTGYCSTWSLHHNRWTMNPAGKFESLVIRQPIDWIWTRCDFLSRHLATRLATPKVETFFNVDSNIQMFFNDMNRLRVFCWRPRVNVQQQLSVANRRMLSSICRVRWSSSFDMFGTTFHHSWLDR